MLKITAPFKEKKEAIPLIEAGADELYCGYLSPEWTKQYTSIESFERRGGIKSNFTDLKELAEAVDLAHTRNVPVYLAINGFYVNAQYPLLLKIVQQLEKIDLDAFIVADIGLLLTLREMKTKKQIHISNRGSIFNFETVGFYQSLGASRIILDRQTTFESMKTFSEHKPDGIDFEVFILIDMCTNIDGFCTFLHTRYKEPMEDISRKEGEVCIFTTFDIEEPSRACSLEYSIDVFNVISGKKINRDGINPIFYRRLVDGCECGACAIYEIMHLKIKSIKITGRALDSEAHLTNVKFIHTVLDIFKNNQGINKQSFINKVQRLYRKTFGYKKRCQGNNCYYPEVLLKNGKSSLYYQD